MNTPITDTLADLDNKIASIMGTGGASVEDACRALDECGGNVDHAKALLYGGTVPVTRQEATARNNSNIYRPTHHHGRYKNDIDDDSIDKPYERQRNAYMRNIPAAASGEKGRHETIANTNINSTPSHILRHRKGDIDDTAAFQPSSEPSSYSAFSVAANPNPPRTARTPLPVTPGAVAVAGPYASHIDEDEYTVTAQAQVQSPPATLKSTVNKEPVTARVVHDTEQDVELLQDQIREQNERLEQLERERENAVVAQVVVGDEEAQDTNDDNKAPDAASDSEGEATAAAAKQSIFSDCGQSRKKWFILIILLAVVGIVVGIVVGVTSSPPSTSPPISQPTMAPSVGGAMTCNDQTVAFQQDPSLTVETPELSPDDDCVTNTTDSVLLKCEIDFGEVNAGFQQACLNAGGQYLPVDTQVTCTLTSNPTVTAMLGLQDFPACLGRACDLNAIDDDLEKEIENAFIQGLESDGSLDCTSGT